MQKFSLCGGPRCSRVHTHGTANTGACHGNSCSVDDPRPRGSDKKQGTDRDLLSEAFVVLSPQQKVITPSLKGAPCPSAG
ncbi:hypothetical protein CEXT_287551 [Caerostris extrusa]|uniref:Uncharacterized protein n=1 Tax=Caerostris extrusa TaxID=172846 RepID=A0AAV4QB07_CAEEX|nr:hypothetical protein CEXT_287551 [Caerostris extrusa]